MGQSNGNHEHLGRGEGRGDPRRVADVHAQTRRGLTQAAVFLAAAVAAALAGIGEGWWLPLHLFVVGSLLSAISAGALMLSVTWSAAPAPRPAIATSQRGLLAAGAVGLVVGRELGWTQLFVAGGAAVIASMLGLVVMLLRVRREAVTARFAPAIEGYVVAVAAGSAGMVMGILVIAGPAQTRLADLRAAHLTLNLFGLVGLVVAGTLPFFAATQVRARMSRRATPRAMRASLAVLVAAVTITTAGHLISRSSIVAIGLLQYSLALVAVATMLPIYSTRRMAWAGPRVWQLATGVGWWIAMTVALAVATLRGVDDRPVLQALVIGGYAQILVASLAYLGPVARGGGHRRLTAGFATTRSWVSLVAGNAAALAALARLDVALAAILSVWLIDAMCRAMRLRWSGEGRAAT